MKNISKCNIAFLFLGLFYSFNNVLAQPNLSAPWGNITATSVNHCQNFECFFTVKNIGTATAPSSFAYICISNNTSFSSPYYVSAGSSVKSLTVGDSTNLYFTFSIPASLVAGTYYVGIQLNSGIFRLLSTPFTISSSTNNSVKIPYPIIFIHGLNSCDTTWNDFTDNLDNYYGFQFGGRMNFCLNYDGNQSTSNFSTDYHDFTNVSLLTSGDYYYLNFAVNNLGNYDADPSISGYMFSNQSAIFKQGRAVRDAIKHVLQVTGRDKVILVGHSMGGLASREYLENSSIWQSDGKHHIAKLFTIGTPHGGSNLTGSILTYFLNGTDEYSEAVRDLRYNNVVYSGVYLDGGYEPTISTYHSNDINCNGVIGDLIVGLNQKSIPTDLNYACTIGTGTSAGDDGVVEADRANLNNYYSTHIADTFIDAEPPLIYAGGLYEESHTILPKNFEINMKGLDEDNNYSYDYPYHISLNNSYYGFVQQQSLTPGYATRDYDNYTFKITQKGTTKIKIENIITPDFNLWLIDSSNTTYALSTFPISSNQDGNIDVNIQLPIGKYILQTDAAPIINGYYYPYLLKTAFTNNWSTTSYTICSPSTQTLTAPSGFSSYLWNNGATTQSIIVNTTGYYCFKATNSYGYTGGWSDSVHVTVNPLPIAGTISGLSSVCVGSQITLSHTGAAGIWSATNGNANISSTGIVTGVSAGSDVITYSVTNSCGTATVEKNITVNPLPIAGTISGLSSVCVGSQITLSHTGAAGIWSATNGNANISSTGIVTGVSAGSDVITYSVTNSCGTATVEKNITINPLPNAGTISGLSSVCVGSQINLSHTGVGGMWSAENANANVNGGIITGESSGTDNISYSVTNSCGTDYTTKQIVINQTPDSPTISQNFNLLLAPVGYDYYQWTLNGSPIPGATNNNYTVISTGSYGLVVSNSFGCSKSSQQLMISSLTYNANDIEIYPNPSTSIVFVKWYKKVTIKLTCLDGKSMKAIENANEIDLGDFPNGNYLITIYDENNNKLKSKVITKIAK